MRHFSYLIVIFIYLLCSCSAEQKTEVNPFQQHQKEQHEFMLSEKSPLEKVDKKNFIALNYFSQDSSFVFKAKYESVFNGRMVEFNTNTDRKPIYIHTGNIKFNLEKSQFTLKAYQAQNSSDSNLFLPFNDFTNGVETYKSGRYLDLIIPEYDAIILDFNLAYNPYCAYNKKYSCPIPPTENRLKIEIKAGEKTYH